LDCSGPMFKSNWQRAAEVVDLLPNMVIVILLFDIY